MTKLSPAATGQPDSSPTGPGDSGRGSGLGRWLMANRVHPAGPETQEGHAPPQPWWKVMCLTGVDYFSTLSYLPGIAALAAGALSPLATLLIVALTLLGMLPMYWRVARESPHGQGSVAMLEKLLPFWRGKVFVLVLLGFVATSWIVTITLSSADATVHLLENPLAPDFLHGQAVPVTIVLLLILGGVFLLGFNEAVAVAIPLVAVFLAVNLTVIGVGLARIAAAPELLGRWVEALTVNGVGFGDIAGPAILAFPLLVLGLSGFETGVSMMPLVRSTGSTPEERLANRIKNTRRLLTAAALIMSVFLIGTSFITTVLIPAEEFAPGGAANGRAMAYLAHEGLGEVFGTVYDLSSITILWFAGASAMAGLINIVPRYLPAYGMAPEWGRAVRPVVIVYTAVCIIVTLVFNADVDEQAGAYATGVLAMMVSGAVAVTISAVRRRQRRAAIGFAVLTAILLYAIVANIIAHPDGIIISALFIAAVITVSLISRLTRSLELRVDRIELDEKAQLFIRDCTRRTLRLVANEPDILDQAEYSEKRRQILADNDLTDDQAIVFVEVTVTDPSEFSRELRVQGVVTHGQYRVLRLESPTVPNALAALLLHLRDQTGYRPHIYLEWTEGNPISHFLRFLFLGVGETAPVTREIIRRAEPDRSRRPHVHVG
ncbi:amino acid transporter [Microlunatus sp. GCM10028923]|uniref:amino acid transporter n=1 Tax=Microlunatus sp. GCM10028923 TaxID=3273400 RepID=UPI00360FC5D8